MSLGGSPAMSLGRLTGEPYSVTVDKILNMTDSVFSHS